MLGGKAKSVQQTTGEDGAAPGPETPVAGDDRRRLRAKRARPAEAVPDEIDEYGQRSPSSGESEPEPDAWRPGDSHDWVPGIVLSSAGREWLEFKQIFLNDYQDMKYPSLGFVVFT